MTEPKDVQMFGPRYGPNEETLLTIGEITKLFGVSARTIRHYDEIGLVQPTARSWSGYRLYGRQDIARLAQVVMLRRLQMPLSEIEVALASGSTAECLRAHRESVIAQLETLSGVLSSIDRALEAEMTKYSLTPEEMKEVFGDAFDESYAAEVEARWGNTDAYRESQWRAKSYNKSEWEAIKAESDAVMDGFARAMGSGETPDSQAAHRAVQAHRDHIEKWFNPVPLDMLACLGQMYVSDPRFAKTYNDIREGLAQYVSDAVAAYCNAVSEERAQRPQG